MDLRQLQQLLNKYQDGTATPAERLMVEQWLQQPEHEGFAPGEEERDQIGARILEKVGMVTRGSGRRPGLFSLRSPLSRAAVILAAIVGLTLLGLQYRDRWAAFFGPARQISAHAGAHEILHVLLPDSTVVVLYHNSTIIWPEKAAADRRVVKLTGQAYFNVARDDQRPFLLSTGDMAIKVLGTSFIARDIPEERVARVQLLTGKVDVGADGRSLGTLTPETMISFNKDQRKAVREHFSPDGQVTGWLDKRFIFKETPLQEVWKAIGGQTGRKIVLDPGTKMQGSVFTGEFTEKDSLTNILDIISLSTGLKCRLAGDSAIMISH